MHITRVLALIILLLSMQAHSAWALESADARHLLLRAGFGAEPVWMQAITPLNRSQAVSRLLSQIPVSLPVPDCVLNPIPGILVLKGWDATQRMDYRKKRRQCGRQFKQWYVKQLLTDNAVLHQQLTLFWHNHFTSSLKKVKEPQLMLRQHQLLQKHALGNFAELLRDILHDPAMLIYLDNVNNKKKKPNENLARELLELFTLGEGHYTEQDIREVARALTGLSRDRHTYQFRFYPGRHDKGEKTVLGVTGLLAVEDIVAIILRQPQAAEFITRKIWLNYISEADEVEIKRLANDFSIDWNIRALVNAILLSPKFWKDKGKMIKSPVDLVIGSARVFNSRMLPKAQVVKMMARMGQDLFDPPNVKGWPVGYAWVDTDRVLVRASFGERLTRGMSNEAMAEDLARYCGQKGPEILSAVAPLTPAREQADCQNRLENLVTDPVWQLK